MGSDTNGAALRGRTSVTRMPIRGLAVTNPLRDPCLTMTSDADAKT